MPVAGAAGTRTCSPLAAVGQRPAPRPSASAKSPLRLFQLLCQCVFSSLKGHQPCLQVPCITEDRGWEAMRHPTGSVHLCALLFCLNIPACPVFSHFTSTFTFADQLCWLRPQDQMWTQQPCVNCLTGSHDCVSPQSFKKAIIIYVSPSSSLSQAWHRYGKKITLSGKVEAYLRTGFLWLIVSWVYHSHHIAAVL